ncbi:glycogen debranching enzyme GlgX, partial [Streptomyces sp. MZ04]
MSSAAEQEALRGGRRGTGAAVTGQPAAVNGTSAGAPTARASARDAADARRPPVWPGAPTPLGARFRVGPDGVAGTNFALWAGGAEAVELCL